MSIGSSNKRIKLMRRRSPVLWERSAHSLSAVSWMDRRIVPSPREEDHR
jgi:hypothetical protein